jgi:hypothetical protein
LKYAAAQQCIPITQLRGVNILYDMVVIACAMHKGRPYAAGVLSTDRLPLLPFLSLLLCCCHRYKMLMMAEQVHETHLQTVLSETLETTDWAGEPAWEADFSVISEKYGQRVRQFLFWWGGALAHLRWNSDPEEGDHEEPAAKVSVVVSGEQGDADAAGGAAVKLSSE